MPTTTALEIGKLATAVNRALHLLQSAQMAADTDSNAAFDVANGAVDHLLLAIAKFNGGIEQVENILSGLK
jgi:hypothetical protein